LNSERSVVALLASFLTSAMASAALDTVLGIQVFAISERPLDLGLLGLASFAPAALLVLVTGAVADRFERRRVAAAAMAAEALTGAALFAYLSSKPTTVAPIFAFAFVFGVARAFASPAIRALPADIVGADRVPWVVARTSATWQVALILGPVLGGFLYAANPRLPYAAVALLALTGAFTILLVHPVQVQPAVTEEPLIVAGEVVEPPAARSNLAEAVEGFRFIRSQPIVLGAISLDLFAVLFGGAVALLPAHAEDRLHVGAVGIGWLRAAAGIGAAIVTLRLAVRPLHRHVGRWLLGAVSVFGVATIALGGTRIYAVAFVAMLVLAGADSISVFVRATLVPLVTPQDKRGRVLAVESVFIGASNELGAFESGVAGQILGAAGAVVLGGAATLAVALGWSRVFPALRDVDEFPTAPDSYPSACLSAAATAAPVAAALRYGSGACARWPLSTSTSSTRSPNRSASATAAALSPTARTLTQRCTPPGHTPTPSTGAGSSWPKIIGDARGEPSVTSVCTLHCRWFASAMYDNTVPSEWATIAQVSPSMSGSMRARIRSRRSGSVAITATMSTVRSNTASLAACPRAAIVSPPARSVSISAIPARDCSSRASASVPGARRNRSP
jgi:MFS family permease